MPVNVVCCGEFVDARHISTYRKVDLSPVPKPEKLTVYRQRSFTAVIMEKESHVYKYIQGEYTPRKSSYYALQERNQKDDQLSIEASTTAIQLDLANATQ